MNRTVGARASRLSVAQTDWVIGELRKADPEHTYDMSRITTRGDTDSRPLFAIDQKGIFEKEIDRAVSEGRVDFAVHSLKDVPSELPGGLELACVPRRAEVNDVLVTRDGSDMGTVPRGARVGTSSLRRAVQIMRSRPDLTVRPVRGNIETRIRRVLDGQYGAIVLAQAGIMRLGLDVRYARLPVEEFIPSPGQGALGLVARSDDTQTIRMLKCIEDPQSRAETEAERALSDRIDSGCRFPIGACATARGGEITLRVAAYSADGDESVTVQERGPADDPAALGRRAGERLLRRGADRLALNWRKKVTEWNRT